MSPENSKSQGKSQSTWHYDLILTHAVTKPSLVTCLEDLKECHPIFMLTATTALSSPFIQNLSYEAIIAVVLRQGFPNWAQRSRPVAVTADARQMRVFLSELCLCCLFILPWEVLPLIVDCGVKTGSPLSLAQPLPICLNSDKDVHPLAGWKTVKNTNDAFEQALTHMLYNPPTCFFFACHAFIVSVFEGHSHTHISGQGQRSEAMPLIFVCLNVKNCRTPPLCIGTSKESWRQSSACHSYGDCLEVKTVRQNVQAKPISWCLNLCNLNIKFDSSAVIIHSKQRCSLWACGLTVV